MKRISGWSCSVFFLLIPTLLRKLYGDGCCCTEPQKSSGYDQGTTMRKNIRVVTPRCAAAAVVSAVVLRRPTKKYTHRYSMMHRRLTTSTAGEVAPHYHQLLVVPLGLPIRACSAAINCLHYSGQSKAPRRKKNSRKCPPAKYID